jgi:hypothetical protein
MTAPNEPEPQDRGPERSPQLQAFEAQLAALAPRDDRLDRDRLMYMAGQASVAEAREPRHERQRWAWPASLGAFAGAAAASLAIFVARPAPIAQVITAATPQPRQTEAIPALSSNHWVRVVAADVAMLRDLSSDRLLTAGMTLRPAQRALAVAAPPEPAGDTPAAALVPQPRLTTRSFGELLPPTTSNGFSS